MKKKTINQCTIYTVASMFLLLGCTGSPPVKESEDTPVYSSSLDSELHETSIVQEQSSVTNRTVSSPVKTAKAKGLHRARADKMAIAYPVLKAERRELRRAPRPQSYSQESYNSVHENGFVATNNDPLSTFSIDVDTASYANIRRWINSGKLPPVGAVRVEEMVNYFSYDYPAPKDTPVAITSELGPCPWNPESKLVRIGLKAKELMLEKLPPSNLIFLIDVSGSMNQPNKLPLLKKSMLMLTNQLTSQDRVGIVVYAGSDRVVLPPTAGNQKETIKQAIASLTSGGSTHGSQGIVTAYKLAQQSHMPSGNNRIILASDGDFNVGVTSRGELEKLITTKRDSGVFLSVLGFGEGNYHDDTMELLADKGNGNYNYIDSILEAKKVLIKERASTFYTVATDVKIQVEFNPALVGGYRLIGYENRNLADEDFNNDKKDAGEMGAGHTVTAVYELLSPTSPLIPKVDQLKYQSPSSTPNNKDLLTVKIRYKNLNSDTSNTLTHTVIDRKNVLTKASDDFRFTCSVLGFAQLLRQSEYSNLTYLQLISLAKTGRGSDSEGYRAEFIKLLEMAELLTTHN